MLLGDSVPATWAVVHVTFTGGGSGRDKGAIYIAPLVLSRFRGGTNHRCPDDVPIVPLGLDGQQPPKTSLPINDLHPMTQEPHRTAAPDSFVPMMSRWAPTGSSGELAGQFRFVPLDSISPALKHLPSANGATSLRPGRRPKLHTHLSSHRWISTVPKGLHSKALGCEARATQGSREKKRLPRRGCGMVRRFRARRPGLPQRRWRRRFLSRGNPG